MCMVAQRLKKIKLLFYVAFTLNRNILIIFFSFLFFSPLFHFCSLLLSSQSSHFISAHYRRPSPCPTLTEAPTSADHSLRSPQLHPLSLCYLMPSANMGLYLTFSLSRSPPQRPNLRAPPSLYYLLPSVDVGLCLCFSICCGQWLVFVFVAVGLCFPICGHFGAIDKIFGGILFTMFSNVAVVGAAVKTE